MYDDLALTALLVGFDGALRLSAANPTELRLEADVDVPTAPLVLDASGAAWGERRPRVGPRCQGPRGP